MIWQPTGKRNVSASQPSEIPISRIAEIVCPDEWAIYGKNLGAAASAERQSGHNPRKPRSNSAARLVSQVL